MKNLFGTQMHGLTAVLIALETIFLFIQLNDLFRYPLRKSQWWDFWLLKLLIAFNLTNGFFPDEHLAVNIRLQYMIAYGTAYLAGSYFPFYFYKMYRLKSLRPWATWGVLVFVLVPFLVCDVTLYGFNGALVPDREWGVLVPAAYGLIVLYVMLMAIRKKFLAHGDMMQYRCELLVWACLLPWEALSLVAFYPQPQWLRVLAANIGWVAIITMRIIRFAHQQRHRDQLLDELTREISMEEYLRNCLPFGFSERETEIVLLFRENLTTREIGERLFIAELTVQTHITKIMRKTACRNRREVLRLLTAIPGKR